MSEESENPLKPLTVGMITIDRPWAYFWSARKFLVLIDERKFGHISVNSKADFCVEPGSHTVSIQVDMTKTKPLNIQVDANQKCIIICRPISFLKFLNPIVWFLPNTHVELEYLKTEKIEEELSEPF